MNTATAPTLTRRDHIAALVMAGLTANPGNYGAHITRETMTSRAELAVACADALLHALDRKEEP